MHALYCKPCPKFEAEEAIGHDGEATAVLLSGHDVSCQIVFWILCLCSQFSATVSLGQGHFFCCCWRLSQSFITGQNAENKWLMNTQAYVGHTYHTSKSRKVENSVRATVKGVVKHCLPGTPVFSASVITKHPICLGLQKVEAVVAFHTLWDATQLRDVCLEHLPSLHSSEQSYWAWVTPTKKCISAMSLHYHEAFERFRPHFTIRAHAAMAMWT